MFKRTTWLSLLSFLVVGVVSLICLPQRSNAATLPSNFTDSLVANIASPTAIAFTPDGRMLITAQPGKLYVYQNGSLVSKPALDLGGKICTNGERGLLGVAVAPDFATSKRIFVYYSFNKNNTCANNASNSPVNRVARFTLGDNNVVDVGSETVLIDNIASPNGNHNAGDLHFGKDGYLYVSIGDGGCDYADSSKCAGANDASRDQHMLLGKILRIGADGSIPSSNPFRGSDSARCNVAGRTDAGKKCQETFAWGLRNPFRMNFDPNASNTRFFINDVGQNVWEEIDEGKSGADYGWNCREGKHTNNTSGPCNPTPANMVDPIYEYNHNTGCASITGGAFVPNGVWPGFDGAYLYSDYVCGKIFKLIQSGSTYSASEFVTGLGTNSAVHLTFGPYNSTQALYYTTYAGGCSGCGQVRRVTYTGSTNRAPTADIAANPTTGNAPLAVSFNGSGSSDPDGDTLTYIWNFGDGSAERQTTTATTSYTYASDGTYTASLKVRDSKGATSPADTIRIDVGNDAPLPTISAPTTSDRFAVGQSWTLRGSATDPEDGTLPDSALSWRIIQHHNEHTHPFLGPQTGNNIPFTTPAPEDLAATTTSYLEIELTATDSQGRTTTISQRFDPHKVDVNFQTSPTGLKLTVNDTTITGPTKLTSWEAYKLNVKAQTQTDSTGKTWEFVSWSDGGAAAYTITTPATAATYTATFKESSGGSGLQGSYYDNPDFTGTKVTRSDATIDFDWGNGSPVSGIGADTFSVRWQGKVQPRYSETYTFFTTSDDGVRLWVDGKLIINNWTNHVPTENSGTIALTGGQKYSIRMEFYDNTGGAVAKLAWSSSSQAKQIVPQSRLYPEFNTFLAAINFQPSGAAVPNGYTADNGAVYGDRGNGLSYGWNAANANTRDRDASNALDQRYDTLNHMQKDGSYTWQIAVPNGLYSVRVVAGDADYFNSTYKLNAESTLVINGTPTSSNRWLDNTATVTVSDGKLTISNASGAQNNKICFVEVVGF